MYGSFFKRLLDFSIALILFVIFSPVFLLVMVVLAVQNEGRIFFYQERPGRYERPMTIIKFKSMNDRMDKDGVLLPDNQRLTRAGAFIRMTSMDELPQLINVLKGDMSLVGPRPLLFKYLPLYNDEQKRRHLVRPGITGLAQVSGRNSISWMEKFKYDTDYVDNITFLLDIKILLLTVKKVLIREGVNQSDARPMEPFNGHN